jgi:signal transduction histidine kinase/ligand-binding sensor domain-containing protein
MRISRTDRSSSPSERADEVFDGEPRQLPIVSHPSNTPKPGGPRLLLFCFVLFFLAINPVSALDTGKQISQYGHTAWRIGDGVFAETPNVIAQTTDGYVWIGTQAGLMRFDGVRFVAWRPPEGKELPSSRITSLLGARDESLWIGTSMGLARWRNGNLTNYRDVAGSIMSILEDRAGTIWIARANLSDTNGPLCKVTDAALRCYGRDDGLALPYAVTLANDTLGNIWLAGGLMVSRWQTSSADTYVPAGLNPAEIFNGVLAIAGRLDGSLWVGLVHAGKGGGLQQLSNGTWKPFVTPDFDGSRLEVTSLLLDRDTSLWVGTLNQGIYRIQGNKVDHFRSSDGLSGDAVTHLFQDREGNIWVSTSRGVDKFRDLGVASFSTRQGLSADQVNAVLASRDGTVWIGNYNLDVLRSGKITSIQPGNGLPGRAVTSLFEDRAGRLWVGIDKELSVYEHGKFTKIPTRDGSPLGGVRAMAEDVDGSIWVVTSNTIQTGRRLLRIQDLRVREEISSPQLTDTNTLASDPRGGVWLGFITGAVARYRNGQMEFLSLNESPHDGPVHGLLVNSDGSVLAATPSGVVGWRNGRVQRLTVRNGLPCDVVYALISDRTSTLWLYAACGLIAIPNMELQRWWQSPDVTVRSSVLDVFDGAQPMSTPFRPNASQSPDGRLWFANENVVQMIDPAHLDGNPIPPPVHIEQVTADRKIYWQNLSGDASSSHLKLPPLVRDLTIDYTALSLVVPEKVHFRFKLEGQDRDWREVVNDREVQYSNLGPGNYRFRVTASNNSGVWNEAGTFLDFSIAPAYYQTNWFRLLCLAALVVLLWMLYKLRVHSIQQHSEQLAVINAKLEAQIAERKQAEEALRQAQADLTHANRVSSMGELTASLAHEVKQPIAAAITNANTCLRWLSRDQPDLEEVRAAASQIVQDGRRAGEIVNRVRLLFEKDTLQRELVDLNEIIREMTLLLHSEAIKFAVSIRTELAADLPQVMADRVQLQQVLMNLMMNSIDAMRDVDGRRELTINSQRDQNGQVLISVSDTGVGLPPQQADKIFNAFFTTKTHGTGMGLRISRTIVESHGGRLWAADNSPRGATFQFTLAATVATTTQA